LRYFQVLSSSGRIFTKPRQRPCEKRTDANLKERKASQEYVKEEKISDLKNQAACLACCIDVIEEKAEAWPKEIRAAGKQRILIQKRWSQSRTTEVRSAASQIS
jgi:hypothetical protein